MDQITDDSLLLVRMRELFPPAISLPGVDMEIRDVDHETGTTTLRFEVSDARANQFGSVQGGVVATMLDACIGIAGAVRSGGVLAMPLAEMNVSFIRPAQSGTLIGERNCDAARTEGRVHRRNTLRRRRTDSRAGLWHCDTDTVSRHSRCLST